MSYVVHDVENYDMAFPTNSMQIGLHTDYLSIFEVKFLINVGLSVISSTCEIFGGV